MKLTRILVTLSGLVSAFFIAPQAAIAIDCPIVDYSKLSFNGTPNANWKNGEPTRVVTWSSNATVIGPDPVSTPFSETEQAWLQQAFDNYGEILDSIAFQKVSTPDTANIVIGYTVLSKAKILTETSPGAFGLWGFSAAAQKGGIALLDPKLWPRNFNGFRDQNAFVLRVENELGNVLGVPDVNPFGPPQSLVSIYDTSKFQAYGQTKINDYDAAIIRQLYGESTCSMNYTPDARAKNLATDKILGDKFMGKYVALAPTATPMRTTATSKTNVTITCVKGSSIKKVTAVKPVCPKGYKKK